MTTPSFNPVIRVDEVLPWWLLPRRPAPGPNTALVLAGKGQSNMVLTAGGVSKLNILAWQGYQYAYWIDVSERSFLIDCTLPTKVVGLDFQAAVYIAYKVLDPGEIVHQHITDARAEIEEPVKRLMREKSRLWLLNQSADAEKSIRDAINTELRSGVVGVTRCFVSIDVEDEIREYARKQRTADRNYVHSVRNAKYTKDINRLDAEIGQAMTTFYNNLSQPGYAQFLLLHLASNRDQIEAVLGALNRQRDHEREHWLKMLDTLNKAGALEPSDWAALRKTVIDRLIETFFSTAASAGSNGSAPGLSAGGGGGGNGATSASNGNPPSGGPAAGSSASGGTSQSAEPEAGQSANVGVQAVEQKPLKELAVNSPSNPPPS